MSCEHVTDLPEGEVEPQTTDACADCLELGEDDWVQLRMCLSCGYVGCCDSSQHRHATQHFRRTAHPVMRSMEPGQDWRWCYLDNRLV